MIRLPDRLPHRSGVAARAEALHTATLADLPVMPTSPIRRPGPSVAHSKSLQRVHKLVQIAAGEQTWLRVRCLRPISDEISCVSRSMLQEVRVCRHRALDSGWGVCVDCGAGRHRGWVGAQEVFPWSRDRRVLRCNPPLVHPGLDPPLFVTRDTLILRSRVGLRTLTASVLHRFGTCDLNLSGRVHDLR